MFEKLVAKRIGNWSIVIEKMPALNTCLTNPEKYDTIIKLFEHTDSGLVLWMSDSDGERNAFRYILDRLSGDKILIGGLGLGLVCHMLYEENPNTTMTVIEIEKDVIDLVAHSLPDTVELIHGDFFKEIYALKDARTYTDVIGDMWRETASEVRIPPKIVYATQKASEECFPTARLHLWGWAKV